MAVIVNAGLSKKVGLPNYGSIGASCHVEFEVDTSLLQTDLAGFHEKIHHAYATCAQAVHDELARHRPGPGGGNGEHRAAQEAGSGNGQGNGSAARESANGDGAGDHRVTERQLAYLRQLAGQTRGLGLRGLDSAAQSQFGKPLAEMTSREASSLIDTLKAVRDGELDLDQLLGGGAS